MDRCRALLAPRLHADLWELERELFDAVHVHVELAVALLEHAAKAVVLAADAFHLLLQVLHLLDGRHAPVSLLGELTLDVSAGALGAAGRLGGVALDLALPAG